MTDPRITRLADLLINHSTRLEKGEQTAEVVGLALGAVGVAGPSAHEAAIVAAANTTRIAYGFIRFAVLTFIGRLLEGHRRTGSRLRAETLPQVITREGGQNVLTFQRKGLARLDWAGGGRQDGPTSWAI